MTERTEQSSTSGANIQCGAMSKPKPPRTAARTPSLFFFNDTATTEIYTPSLHDALPLSGAHRAVQQVRRAAGLLRSRHRAADRGVRSEEHTSELQSRRDLVCRLLLE